MARNVTGDSERPVPSTTISFPVPVANGTSEPCRVGRPKERPRSTGSQLEALKAVDVKRTASIRLEDISGPRLQSSTNATVGQGPASRTDEVGTKLQPTRVAPAPPAQNSHKPPQRPPPPYTTAKIAGNQYEEISLRSPTGPPPAPPDSRHRFYSSQLPRQSGEPDGNPTTATVSVSNMRSKFEPVRSSSPSQSNAVPSHRQMRRNVKNGSDVVPAKSPTPAATRTQLAAARPSTAVNESQC